MLVWKFFIKTYLIIIHNLGFVMRACERINNVQGVVTMQARFVKEFPLQDVSASVWCYMRSLEIWNKLLNKRMSWWKLTFSFIFCVVPGCSPRHDKRMGFQLWRSHCFLSNAFQNRSCDYCDLSQSKSNSKMSQYQNDVWKTQLLNSVLVEVLFISNVLATIFITETFPILARS